jgi:hypothetical protein
MAGLAGFKYPVGRSGRLFDLADLRLHARGEGLASVVDGLIGTQLQVHIGPACQVIRASRIAWMLLVACRVPSAHAGSLEEDC